MGDIKGKGKVKDVNPMDVLELIRQGIKVIGDLMKK